MTTKKTVKKTVKKTINKSVEDKAFSWIAKHQGKVTTVSANTAIGAKKEAKKKWGIKAELRDIEVYIKR